MPIFSSNVLLCTRIQPKVPHCIQLSYLISPPIYDSPSFFPVIFFLITLTHLNSTGQIFCRKSLNLGSSEVFFMIRLDCRFQGRTPQRSSALLTELREHTKEHDYNPDPQLVKVVDGRSLHCRVTVFTLPYSICQKSH